MSKEVAIRSADDLKVQLATNYQNQINNFFGDEKRALEFLSNVVAEVKKNPALLECDSTSLFNSFVTMASLKLMPSSVSGEAYVLPYNKKGGGKEAQFQMGYMGYVTLFYRAGVTAVQAEIVREKDDIKIVSGQVMHSINPMLSSAARGKAVGAYVAIVYKGSTMYKYMHADDIMEIGRRFSKSFNSQFSPWNEKNDPELWMWKKTVIIQMHKLIPKSNEIVRAIEADYQDSVINDRMDKAVTQTKPATMGNLIKTPHAPEENEETTEEEAEQSSEGHENQEAGA